MRYPIAGLCLLLTLTACPPRPQTAGRGVEVFNDEEVTYEDYRPAGVDYAATYTFPKKRRPDPANYRPDTSNLRYLPIRYLRVNFHVMNTADTLFPYHGERARQYFRDLVVHTNNVLKRTPELWLRPAGTTPEALPRRLILTLAGEPSILEHYDDEVYAYQHTGRRQNRGDRRPLQRYGVSPDSILNIFVMGPSRDSLAKKNYQKPGANGVFLSNHIKVTGILSQERGAWDHAGNLAHEIGHALGLGHAWRADGCDDTPEHDNSCWYKSARPECDSLTSNNLMDYSYRQEALTPCQIGRIHGNLSNITGRQRKWLLPYWCRYNPNEAVRVTKNLDWNGDRDFNSDIFVRRGYALRINARVHLPEGAAIHVDPGARLVLGPGAVVHNSCGGSWRGIRLGRNQYGDTGTVDLETEGATFVNIPL